MSIVQDGTESRRAYSVGFLSGEYSAFPAHDEIIATGTQADGNPATEQLEREDIAVLDELVSELILVSKVGTVPSLCTQRRTLLGLGRI